MFSFLRSTSSPRLVHLGNPCGHCIESPAIQTSWNRSGMLQILGNFVHSSTTGPKTRADGSRLLSLLDLVIPSRFPMEKDTISHQLQGRPSPAARAAAAQPRSIRGGLCSMPCPPLIPGGLLEVCCFFHGETSRQVYVPRGFQFVWKGFCIEKTR